MFGEWLSLVEHLLREQGVGGSNPLSPTILFISFDHRANAAMAIRSRGFVDASQRRELILPVRKFEEDGDVAGGV
jgi:hypothetical protein